MEHRGPRYPSGRFLGSYSFGHQISFRHIPGRNADCAQSAAGNVAGRVRMGSIDPVSHAAQPLAERSARRLDPSHQLTALAIARYYQIPPNAQGICYFNRMIDSWHFGRFEPDGSIVHADAELMSMRPGLGGTFAVHPPAADGSISLATVTGQRGVTPGMVARNVADFVAYCGREYDNNYMYALYYYVYFG